MSIEEAGLGTVIVFSCWPLLVVLVYVKRAGGFVVPEGTTCETVCRTFGVVELPALNVYATCCPYASVAVEIFPLLE